MIEFTEDCWHEAGIEDKAIADGLEAQPETELRFETPKNFVPVIPPVEKDKKYSAFDSMSEEDINRFDRGLTT